MSDQYVPALRKRFIEDMQIKGLQPKTQTMYLRGMRDFTRFLGRSPDTATPEDLRAFQLDMKERGVGAPTFNTRLTVLSFFFAATCPRPEAQCRNPDCRDREHRCNRKGDEGLVVPAIAIVIVTALHVVEVIDIQLFIPDLLVIHDHDPEDRSQRCTERVHEP